MRYLLIFIMIYGCGIDPDDFAPEKSDGCKSGDESCQQAKVSAEVTDEEIDSSTENPAAETDETITVESEVSVKTKVTIGPNGEEVTADHAEENCAAGRICRGTTKDEVIDLLGEPAGLDKTEPFEVWEWKEFGGEHWICGGFYCEITFRDDLVVDQVQINPRWLDLENF